MQGNIRKKPKQLFIVYCRSILTYGSETQPWMKGDLSRVQASEMRLLSEI